MVEKLKQYPVTALTVVAMVLIIEDLFFISATRAVFHS